MPASSLISALLALAAGSAEFAHAEALCRGPAAEEAVYEAYAKAERVREAPAQPPMRVFDNLYFVGIKSTAAWAIDTREGIILVDALNASDVEAVTGGLKTLGLDPARIRYVVVTHGHGDHFGGARLLQERYGARVVMGRRDWDLVARDPDPKEPPPRRDLDAPASLTLGGETVAIAPMPGHTPGAVALLFPVTDQGRRHVVALPGGLGEPRADAEAHFRSVKAYRRKAWRAGADVFLSNHPFNDLALAKMRTLAARRPGDPHPFVIGREGVRRHLTLGLECGRKAWETRRR